MLEHYNGYSELVDILQSLKNNNKKYMNYGYWCEGIENIEQANIKLCDIIYEEISDGLNNDMKILDVGCGYGEQDIYWSKKIKESNKKIYLEAIDINDESINYAKKTNKNKNISFKNGSATNLKYNDNTFNYVISLESAFHYDKREDFFKEAYRVLKPGGKLIMGDLIYDDDEELNIFNKIARFTFINFFNIPKSNKINICDYKKQLLNMNFNTKIIDITKNTFKPYYSYFFNNLKSKSLLFNFYKYFASIFINKLCNGTTGFKYVITTCVKN